MAGIAVALVSLVLGFFAVSRFLAADAWAAEGSSEGY